MRRRASDNEYLHKDFHGALSLGLTYLEERYGEDAVREYLWTFTRAYFAPLIADLKARGLVALKEHFEALYKVERGKVEIEFSGEEMVVKVDSCPAVMHMRERGHAVARLFHETTKTVNEALCEGTPFLAELIEYDRETGHSIQRFARRPV